MATGLAKLQAQRNAIFVVVETFVEIATAVGVVVQPIELRRSVSDK